MFRQPIHRRPLLVSTLFASTALFAVASCGSETETTDSSASKTTTDAVTDSAANTEAGGMPETPAEPSKVVAGNESTVPDMAAAAKKALFDEPLVVDGTEIPTTLIKRQAIFCSQGQQLMRLNKLQVFIKAEIERRVEAGAKREDFDVPANFLDKVISDAESRVDLAYEGQDVDLKDFYPTADPQWKEQMRWTEIFKKVFLPVNPYDYPPITVEALLAGDEGERLIEVLKEQHDAKVEKEEAGEDVTAFEQGDAMMQQILSQRVIKYLEDQADIKSVSDGIPDDSALVVDGTHITVDSLWPSVEDRLNPYDIWRAKQWLMNIHLCEKALKEAGVWLSDEEAAKAWSDYSDPFKDSLFSREMVATNLKKFPTIDNYKSYHRIYESYQKMIADEITDQELMAIGKRRTASLVSQARYDFDVILCAAYDAKNKVWKENGWEDAKKRADEVMARLEKGESWDDLLEEYSEFYDPPIPTQSLNDPKLKLRDKGRFRNMHRNELLPLAEEHDFGMFLSGSSIVDFIVFDQEVGTTTEPMRGPHGYYISFLKRRQPATMALSVANEDHRIYMTQDYVSERLNAWTQELLAKAEVTGL